ncbi:hypothetical protein BL254_05555 [Protofrankia sp. BMG5.30]|uniref:DUF397 domain-containing protein n=1 Tax=Protofrankia coriariae TaxID=1562887 RepID=A0ABR5F513_9ACTN|nr:hypothetical protein FrCorBMG51_08905 [Protofrankia coriariae]ONH36720.1 hypothetical protein BL254_05555 [Protofrankia sp. BMG5.30]
MSNNPGRSQSSTRTGSSRRCCPSGSVFHAYSHSAPCAEWLYAAESTTIIRLARATPSFIAATQFDPGGESHAWTST